MSNYNDNNKNSYKHPVKKNVFQMQQQNLEIPVSEILFDKGITDVMPTNCDNIQRQTSKHETDVINDVVGDFGIWQLRAILIVFLCKIPASWFMACIIFTAPELYAGSEFTCTHNNSSLQIVTSDLCYLESSSSSSSSEQGTITLCEEFQYNSSFQSLIMEFDLVCGRDILIAWTQFWHLFGVLLGGIIATKLMLDLSPRYVYALGMVTQIICGVATGYARDFSLHCALRCLSAICCALMFTAGQTIFSDITSGVYRVAAIILYDTFWSIGVIFLPGLVWFFNNWTDIYMGITFPTITLIILLLWTPDSPRWLLKYSKSSKDIDLVELMVKEAAEINDRSYKIPSDFRQQLEALSQKLKKQAAPAPWFKLWSGHRRAKIHMIATHTALAVFIINFMGMLLNIRSFGRDYLASNTIAMGFAEIFGCFLALHITLRHNQWKWQLAGGLNILAGIIGCSGWIFTTANTIDVRIKVILWMIIALIPKMGVSCAQSMILASMNELMPLNKKTSFTYSVVTWARIWLLSAPFINVLKKVDVALSLSAYSCLSIIGGVCTCFLLTPSSISPDVEGTQSRYTKKDHDSENKMVWTVDDDVHNTRL